VEKKVEAKISRAADAGPEPLRPPHQASTVPRNSLDIFLKSTAEHLSTVPDGGEHDLARETPSRI
jgi:hypothetical protein